LSFCFLRRLLEIGTEARWGKFHNAANFEAGDGFQSGNWGGVVSGWEIS
jgi:hypothetical protein